MSTLPRTLSLRRTTTRCRLFTTGATLSISPEAPPLIAHAQSQPATSSSSHPALVVVTVSTCTPAASGPNDCTDIGLDHRTDSSARPSNLPTGSAALTTSSPTREITNATRHPRHTATRVQLAQSCLSARNGSSTSVSSTSYKSYASTYLK